MKIIVSCSLRSSLYTIVAVFLKGGCVYPWVYSEVLQGVLERKWNMKTFILLLNDETLKNGLSLDLTWIKQLWKRGTEGPKVWQPLA